MLRNANWRSVLRAAIVPALAAPAAAQVNVNWADFTANANVFKTADGTTNYTTFTTNTDEKQSWTGDFDQDGFTDLVVLSKIPASFPGKRRGWLFMNDGAGHLVDKTDTLGVDSSVGLQGLKDLINSRKVRVGDLDGDGDQDLMTCNTNLGTEYNDGHAFTHPRVYINKGGVGAGWLGFRHEDGNMGTILSASGQFPHIRFCGMALGDVTGDGSLDAFFVDYDTDENESGNPEPQGGPTDTQDILVINNGSAVFADESAARMTATMQLSAFGVSTVIADVNNDGANDVTKTTTLQSPTHTGIAYNNPANEGFFNFYQTYNTGQPYNHDLADLNNDGKLDFMTADDALDRHAYVTGFDGSNHIILGPQKTFAFAGGSDDGFSGETVLDDLNNDGWVDAWVADFDHDLLGCNRRTHIYHNPGGVVGAQITLKEEAESSSAASTTTWKSVKGMLIGDLKGTYEMAPGMDIENDGDLDLIMFRCTGTFVFLNQASHGANLGNGNGGGRLRFTSVDPASATVGGHLVWDQLPANAAGLLAIGSVNAPTFIDGIGTVVPFPPSVIAPVVASPNGKVLFNNITSGPGTVYVQGLQVSNLKLSNAVECVWN
jgi:hypothetical protein